MVGRGGDPLRFRRSLGRWNSVLDQRSAEGLGHGPRCAVHFQRCVIDGVFAAGEDGQVYFHEAATLTPEDLAAVQQQVRGRVLR